MRPETVGVQVGRRSRSTRAMVRRTRGRRRHLPRPPASNVGPTPCRRGKTDVRPGGTAQGVAEHPRSAQGLRGAPQAGGDRALLPAGCRATATQDTCTRKRRRAPRPPATPQCGSKRRAAPQAPGGRPRRGDLPARGHEHRRRLRAPGPLPRAPPRTVERRRHRSSTQCSRTDWRRRRRGRLTAPSARARPRRRRLEREVAAADEDEREHAPRRPRCATSRMSLSPSVKRR